MYAEGIQVLNSLKFLIKQIVLSRTSKEIKAFFRKIIKLFQNTRKKSRRYFFKRLME